ncbi:conjugal transfer protein TraC [Patescibacteria group bacterium]|nr:conjugal transfer protein TraC [Patescibacteria group bacterium]
MQLFQKSKAKVSSRRQIRIKEVRDGILVLPGNKYRAILETSAINFELKSEDEQDALIDNFQNFLNSLPSSLQILIRIREVDIDRYLEEFAKSQPKETEKVYKRQVESYCGFIKNLVSGNKILSRRFYVVIPYEPQDHEHDFSLIKEQMQLSIDIISKGLEKLGMKTRELNSLKILELFYHFYNPDKIKTQFLKEESFETESKGSHAV